MMEDLREVGQKAIESVGNLGASNAGDLVLGIGEIIEELRKHPDQHQEKLDHLEGLFREFALGEGYELRNNRTEEPEDKDTTSTFTVGYPFPNNGTPIPMSGSLPISSMGGSVAGIPPITPPTPPTPTPTPAQQMIGDPKNPSEDLLDEEEEWEAYEHKWWKKRV